MVAPTPRARRPPPRPQPRPLPPSAGRRPPPYPYGPPTRHHGRRRLLVLVLVLATIGAAGYLYLTRGASTSTSTGGGLVGSEQRVVRSADTLAAGAQRVQRFATLKSFDLIAQAQVLTMTRELTALQHIEAGASGRQQQIAGQAVTDVRQAIDAILAYRKAVVFTYRLSDAATARQDLNSAIADLRQQAQAWQHA